jgi:short-subunit dehydrogenase
MKDFNNKVAVITGAANGIGRAIAEECVKRQMKVVIADIDAEKLHALEKHLKTKTANVLAVVTDVTKESDINLLADKTIHTFNKVNLLFNNVGIAGPLGPIWEINITDFKQVMECNFMSMVYGLKKFIPIMLAQGDECYIVNTGSGAGFGTDPNSTGYSVSKHAIVELTETLYLDLRQRNTNINVSLLSPGLTRTNFSDAIESKDTDSDEIKNIISSFKTLMATAGRPASDVALDVFKGIEKNQFYIFTDFSYQKEKIAHRMNNILSLTNPVPFEDSVL